MRPWFCGHEVGSDMVRPGWQRPDGSSDGEMQPELRMSVVPFSKLQPSRDVAGESAKTLSKQTEY